MLKHGLRLVMLKHNVVPFGMLKHLFCGLCGINVRRRIFEERARLESYSFPQSFGRRARSRRELNVFLLCRRLAQGGTTLANGADLSV